MPGWGPRGADVGVPVLPWGSRVVVMAFLGRVGGSLWVPRRCFGVPLGPRAVFWGPYGSPSAAVGVFQALLGSRGSPDAALGVSVGPWGSPRAVLGSLPFPTWWAVSMGSPLPFGTHRRSWSPSESPGGTSGHPDVL